MSAVCTCGLARYCDSTCAGALVQRQVCATQGHLTAEAIYERVWGERPRVVEGICYRCGDDVAVLPNDPDVFSPLVQWS